MRVALWVVGPNWQLAFTAKLGASQVIHIDLLPGSAADTVATSSASTSAGREVAHGAVSHTTGRLQGGWEGARHEQDKQCLQAMQAAHKAGNAALQSPRLAAGGCGVAT